MYYQQEILADGRIDAAGTELNAAKLDMAEKLVRR